MQTKEKILMVFHTDRDAHEAQKRVPWITCRGITSIQMSSVFDRIIVCVQTEYINDYHELRKVEEALKILPTRLRPSNPKSELIYV